MRISHHNKTAKRLLFVYNADSGLFNKATDFAHKLLSPATYSCKLCEITYDTFGMNKEWEDFVNGLDADVIFLYKDEFEIKYKTREYNFPAIFRESEGDIQLIISDREINDCNSIVTLKKLLLSKI